MKTVKVLLSSLGLAGLLFVGACKDDPVADMEKMVDEVCACEDKECLDKAMKKAQEMGKKYQGKEGDLSEEDMKKVQKLGKKMMKCAMEIETGGGGGDDSEG